MDLPDNIIAQTIDRGDIMHADIFKDIDHGKFFVVLSVVSKEVGYFYINSNINPFLQRRQKCLDMQFPMKPSDYSFLTHVSFLDATKIKRIEEQTIVDSLRNGHCFRVGSMSAEDMTSLLQAAHESGLFNDQELDTFLKL